MRARGRLVKNRGIVSTAASLAIVFAVGFAPGQEKSPGGGWQGAIELPGTDLGISVTLALVSDEWTGKIDIPAQNARNVKLSDVLVEGRTVSWKLPGVPGDPSFFGRLSPDGDAITGHFSQGGKSFPFKLARKAEAPNVPAPEPTSVAAPPKPAATESRPAPMEPRPAPAEPKPAAAEPRPAVSEPKEMAARKPAGDELADAGGTFRGALRGRMDLPRRKDTKPAHTLEDYAGEYEHPTYGTLTVSRDAAGNLEVVFQGITMRLEHWHYETFLGHGRDPALKLFLLFETNIQGDVDRVAVPLEPHVSEIVFTRRPPSRKS